MPIDRRLQITFATLVSLGTMLLGMGQRSLTLPLVTILAAVVSIYVTDLHGWIRLNRPVANLAALLAVVFSVSNFFHVSSEDQLLAVANLLVYLQVVLLFQRKTGRMYWQLLVLNVLQVVVGAALDLDMLFGVLLVVYLFVTLAAMNLLFIQREGERWQRLLAPQQAASGVANTIRASSTLPANPTAELLGPGTLRRTLGIGLGTIVVAAVCFFSMPRFGRSMWAGGGGGSSSVGYSPTVKLGDLGPMLQNPELVMRVTFRDEASGAPITPAETPLFRGSIVTEYKHGEWSHNVTSRPKPGQAIASTTGQNSLHFIRQHVMLEPMAEPVLFAVYPLFEAPSEPSNLHLFFDDQRQQLVRTPESQDEKFEYELLTAGWSDRRPGRIIPQPTAMSNFDQYLHLPDGLPETSRFQDARRYKNADAIDRLTGLRDLAAKTIGDAHLAPNDQYGRAKALEKMLSSPPFDYSLNRPPAAPGVDPIEDFVMRNHSGHCEYFASALALMLRSQGIPARLVIGFRGGEWNPLGSFYDVRQLHAHAWVEAYLAPDQIPESERHGLPVRHGAWLVLDSTPAAETATAADQTSWFASFEDLSDYVSQLWNSYVVGLNPDRQDRVVYQPLARFGETIKEAWHGIELSAADLADRIRRYWIRSPAGGEGSTAWPMFFALGALLAAVFAAAYGVSRIVRRLVRRSSGGRRNAVGLTRPRRGCRFLSPIRKAIGAARDRAPLGPNAIGIRASRGRRSARRTRRQAGRARRAAHRRGILSRALRPLGTGQPASRGGRTVARSIAIDRRTAETQSAAFQQRAKPQAQPEDQTANESRLRFRALPAFDPILG